MSGLFVGIDPGVSGAVAVIDTERRAHVAEFLPVVKTPKTPKRVKRRDKVTGAIHTTISRGTKTEFDFLGAAALFDRIASLPGPKVVVLEAVSAMPRDAVTSAFTFGGSFWAIQMALADRRLSYELVHPKMWQKALLAGVYHNDAKALRAAYLAKARSMFPDVDLHLAKHAEIGAALLIAEFCRRRFVCGDVADVVGEDCKENM